MSEWAQGGAKALQPEPPSGRSKVVYHAGGDERPDAALRVPVADEPLQDLHDLFLGEHAFSRGISHDGVKTHREPIDIKLAGGGG